MLGHTEKNTHFRSAIALLELIFHNTVRQARKTHRNAFIGLGSQVFQAIVFVAVFYLMFEVLGLRGTAIRGDFILYLLSGIFLFLTHTKAVGAIAGSEGPTSGMMQHAPMNTAISIASAALSSLYFQVLSMAVILFAVHTLLRPVVIHEPVGFFAMFLLAWFTGIGVGMAFLALKPMFPGVSKTLTMVYSRANMIASGKMFVANSLPPSMLAFFDWNPLFHSIDQARGFAFINYNPHFTSITYPLVVGGTLLVIGLMGEFHARRYASISWGMGK